jgi:hypothetical protein
MFKLEKRVPFAAAIVLALAGSKSQAATPELHGSGNGVL